MSIALINEVWRNTDPHLKGSRRLVLLALADNANDEHECYPTIKTIARKSGISERFAITCLAWLETNGYITREHRTQNGMITSNHYVVLPSSLRSEQEITTVVNKRSLKPNTKSSIKTKNVFIDDLSASKTDEVCVTPPDDDPPEPIQETPPENELVALFKLSWKRKRINDAQKRAITALSKYPIETIKEFIEWAIINDMPMGKAITAAKTTLPTWGKPKAKTNGNGRNARASFILDPGEIKPVDYAPNVLAYNQQFVDILQGATQ